MSARYEVLAAWADERGWLRGAELGVSDGRTHLFLLEHCPALTLIGVDAWDMPGIEMGPTFSNERCRCPYCSETKAGRKATNHQSRERMVREGIKRFPGRSVLHKMRTIDAAQIVEAASLDFVFIDSDHSMEGVMGDIAEWAPKVKSGGYVTGHDWNMQSVRDGVLVHFPLSRIDLADDHVWSVRVI